MKTMTKISKSVFSLLCIACLLMACSKDGNDGPIGPQGAQGQQGEPGPSGADGIDGQDGQDGATGTANVIFSGWITSTFDNNIVSTAAGIDIEAELLTQEIIDDGVVMVYGRNEGLITGDDVFPLPQIISDDQHAFRLEEAGTIRITILSLEGSPVGSPFFESYRYILIPGGQSTDGNTGPGGLGGKSNLPTIDYTKMSYEKITAYFKIPE